MLFSEALEIRPGLTAVMGSGGKTSLVCRLADELSAARVIIATSTHMRAVPALRRASAPLRPGHARHRGNTVRRRQIRPPEQSWAELCALADYVLVEADGSRGLPLKAHLSHEPVLPQEAGQVIAVLGLTGLGRPIAEAAHRPERYAGAGWLCTGGHCHAGARRARARGRGTSHAGAAQSGRCRRRHGLLARLHCPATLASLRKGEIVSCSF